MEEKEPYEKEQCEHKEMRKNKGLFGRKKKEREAEDEGYEDPDEMDHAHNNFSSENNDGSLPY